MTRFFPLAASVLFLLGSFGLPLPAAAEESPAGAAGAAQPAYAALYDTVLVAHAEAAAASCQALMPALTPESSAEARQAGFVALAEGWGRVEASYILGGYDMAAMDYPLLIDMFHSGKEDIHAKLARALASDSPPEQALFKNSYRSITALDDLMFSGPWSARRAALAQTAAASLCQRLEAIAAGYGANREAFLANPDKALALLIDAQIQNIYKIREWRIGEVVGLTKKTLGRVVPENAQYRFNLPASWAAMGAMLEVHAALLDQGRQPNIATIAAAFGTGNRDIGGLQEVQAALAQAQAAYAGASAADYTDTARMVPLFSALQKLQKAFYDHLALSLGVAAGLVDADGD